MLNGKYWWWIGVGLALLHQCFQYILGIQVSIIDAYLDPLLFFPVVMGGMLWERRWLYRADFTFSKMSCFIYFIVLVILVEGLFPLWNDRFIYDPWDVVAYAVGMLFFMRVINKH